VGRTWRQGGADATRWLHCLLHPLPRVRAHGFPHRFLRGLLHHYKIELQHLNPNGIQHITAFVTLCKGYLGIEPHFEMWKYFFVVSL
jgi:hypothetical protein